jgi:NADH:ubiquinone oxidoreductase subunit 6 (subunit J)
LFLFFVSQIKIKVELALIICVGSKCVCLWIETLCKKFQNTVQTNSQIVKNKHFKIISNHLSCYFWPLEVGQVLLTIAIVNMDTSKSVIVHCWKKC